MQALNIPILIVTPDFVRQPTLGEYHRAARSLREAADLAETFGVRLAIEFQKSSLLCSCLETLLALIAQAGTANAGICLDVFHYYMGPSKFEDLAYLSPENLAWVQLCDVSGTPRELAGDSDRIFPGEGDFQLGPIIEHLARIGYDGYVSLEITNPQLWQVPPDRVVDLGRQALLRAGPNKAIRRAAANAGGAVTMSSVATFPATSAIYHEDQYFDWRVYALIALAGILTGLGVLRGRVWSREAAGGLVIGLVFLMLVVTFVLHMTTEVGPSGLRVWFGWSMSYPRAIAIHSIRSVEVVTYRPIADYGFWGARAGPDGECAFIARGTRGVRLELLDGTKMLIGSQRPEALASVLDGALRQEV